MTPDEFGDPADHTLITRLNGIERQRAKISGMLFDVPRMIESLSEGYTLQPGDVIVTGSPGALPLRPGETPEKPVGKVIVEGQLHMRPGDVCEVEIDGLGVLSDPVIRIRRRCDQPASNASPISGMGSGLASQHYGPAVGRSLLPQVRYSPPCRVCGRRFVRPVAIAGSASIPGRSLQARGRRRSCKTVTSSPVLDNTTSTSTVRRP
jgi:hypothetical protein